MSVDAADIRALTKRWPMAERHDAWSTTSLRIEADVPGAPTLTTVLGLVTSDTAVRAVVSDADESLPVSNAAPTGDETELAQAYLDDAGKAQALAAPTGAALVRLVEDRVRAWVVECDRGAWSPDVATLRDAVKEDWLRVAEAICHQQSLGFADERFPVATSHADGALPVLLGVVDASAPPPGVRAVVTGLADAHAWLAIAAATASTPAADSVEVRLLVDDPVLRPITPGASRGGVHLYQWLHATDDANRAEAVRAELRKHIEHGRDDSLPDGSRVAVAAERTRIALASGNIAAIETAITSATAETRSMVEEIGRRRFELRRDAVRNMLTVILTVLGVSALLVRSPGLSPWLVWSAGLVVSLALIGSAIADERVLGSQIRDARRLQSVIAAREHLPSTDRDALVAELQEISQQRTTPSLGWGVWGATAVAILFVIVAALTVG